MIGIIKSCESSSGCPDLRRPSQYIRLCSSCCSSEGYHDIRSFVWSLLRYGESVRLSILWYRYETQNIHRPSGEDIVCTVYFTDHIRTMTEDMYRPVSIPVITRSDEEKTFHQIHGILSVYLALLMSALASMTGLCNLYQACRICSDRTAESSGIIHDIHPMSGCPDSDSAVKYIRIQRRQPVFMTSCLFHVIGSDHGSVPSFGPFLPVSELLCKLIIESLSYLVIQFWSAWNTLHPKLFIRQSFTYSQL